MKELLSSPAKWHVAIAKSGYYSKAASILDRLNVSFFLPIQRQLHYWSDRKKWVNVPILSPYIFLFVTETERKALFPCCHFLRFINKDGHLATVKENEITQVRLLCDHSENMRLEHNDIRIGEFVEIASGPMKGMMGYALQEKGRHRFLIRLESLGQFASVEIDRNCLRSTDN